MDFSLSKVLGPLVLPPGSVLLLALCGLLLASRFRKLSFALLVLSVGGLYALSTAPVASVLSAGLSRYPPLLDPAAASASAGAIVVLGGGRREDAREYGGDTVSAPALERLRYAARLHRATGLPLLVSGGSVYGRAPSEAELMRDALTEDFGVEVEWMEARSRNTAENARYTAKLLRDAGVDRALLVTHGNHMRRAVTRFEKEGVEVVPAPTLSPSGTVALRSWRDLLPRAGALRESSTALHEHLGHLWYRLRY